MTTEVMMGLAYVLLIAVMLIFCVAATLKRLVLPAFKQPVFSPKANLLDVLGAIVLVGGLFDLLDAYFSSGGILALLERLALYTFSSLGLIGIIVVILFGLAARFALRIALIVMRRST